MNLTWQAVPLGNFTGQMAKDRRQMTEGRCQMTEGRGQRAEGIGERREERGAAFGLEEHLLPRFTQKTGPARGG